MIDLGLNKAMVLWNRGVGVGVGGFFFVLFYFLFLFCFFKNPWPWLLFLYPKALASLDLYIFYIIYIFRIATNSQTSWFFSFFPCFLPYFLTPYLLIQDSGAIFGLYIYLSHVLFFPLSSFSPLLYIPFLFLL